MAIPVLAPHWAFANAHTSDAQLSEDLQHTMHETPGMTSPRDHVPASIAQAPGLPTGKPSKLPVVAVLWLAWGEPSPNDVLLFSGFFPEKEQIAFLLAEQASMALYNAVAAQDARRRAAADDASDSG